MAASPAPCRFVRSEQDAGVVRSINTALRQSVESGKDVLLLEPDTVVFPGALQEIRRVAYCDPLIGFLSPRSNQSGLCAFPIREDGAHLEPAKCNADFRRLSGYLPDFHFVPAAAAFCLFIRFEVLDEFGLFDEEYAHGSHHDIDLMMRANRCGYRAALANHAFVFQERESPAAQETADSVLLNTRYPEYAASTGRYLNSAHYRPNGSSAHSSPMPRGAWTCSSTSPASAPFTAARSKPRKRSWREQQACGRGSTSL